MSRKWQINTFISHISSTVDLEKTGSGLSVPKREKNEPYPWPEMRADNSFSSHRSEAIPNSLYDPVFAVEFVLWLVYHFRTQLKSGSYSATPSS